jgi:tRNA G10  N-methylase Trm11
MRSEFFYKIGHCRDLAIAEFTALTSAENSSIDTNWLLSENLLNVNKTGGLVFGGIVLGKVGKNTKISDFEKFLLELMEMENQIHMDKKVGLSVPVKLSRNVINIAKKAGYKKINLLKDKQPNFGNWKGLKTWYIVFEFENDLCVGKIDTYFDQEFFSKMDMGFPVSDMRRGQINLKLGRSLVNLSSQKTIWDPFCGVGRITAAGLNLKSGFLNSDLDEGAIQSSVKNLEYGQKRWENILKRKVNVAKTAILDAKELSKNSFSSVDFSTTAIVTEGYLGTNFAKQPSLEQCKEQWQVVNRLWKSVLEESEKISIKELVFCLPFFILDGREYLPPFLDNLLTGTGYKFVIFPNKKTYIKYSRKDSIVGHLVVKVVLGS